MEQPLDPGRPGQTPKSSRESVSIVRWTAPAAMLGGVLIVAYAVSLALKPRGCIAEECVGGQIREAGPLDSVLLMSALVLFAAASMGIVLLGRIDGKRERLGKIGAVVVVVALAALLLGGILGSAFGADSSLMYFSIIFPAVVVLVRGFLLVGAGVMRAGFLPRWSGAVLLLATLLLFAANDQTERILFVIPFGLAWAVLGGLMWAGKSAPAGRLRAGIQPA